MSDSLETKIAVLETKIDNLSKQLEDNDLVKRVSSLERWKAYVNGAWFVVGAVIAYLVSLTK